MAKRKTASSTNVTLDRAATIAEKVGDQIKTLIGRNWPEIQEILDSEGGGEIKLAFGTTITDRAATPGEHADKDNSLVTTISFSSKHSDKIESALPDPSQPDLPMDGAEPTVE